MLKTSSLNLDTIQTNMFERICHTSWFNLERAIAYPDLELPLISCSLSGDSQNSVLK
jgi:hypothetical protein